MKDHPPFTISDDMFLSASIMVGFMSKIHGPTKGFNTGFAAQTKQQANPEMVLYPMIHGRSTHTWTFQGVP